MTFAQKNRKKFVALCAACCLFAASEAGAGVDIGLNIGVPGPVYAEPIYVAPEPAYIAPQPAYIGSPAYPAYYHHRHYAHGRRDFHHHR